MDVALDLYRGTLWSKRLQNLTASELNGDFSDVGIGLLPERNGAGTERVAT
jgi:hypothetical protein